MGKVNLKRFLSWQIFGEILEWLAAFYFVGFATFLAITAFVVAPKVAPLFSAAGQGAIFTTLVEFIGPLTLFFLVISAAAWYQGRLIREGRNLTGYDKLVGVALLLVLLILGTPQLYLAISSAAAAIKG
jgi:hypothetical protein